MDCLHPSAPADEELLRFALDEEALPEEASRHLAQCVTCQQRLVRYKDVNSFLLSHLYRSRCPDGSTLSLYCADLLPGDEKLSIAAHVRDCPLCAAEVAESRRFMSTPLLTPAPVSPLRRISGVLVRQQAQLVLRGDSGPGPWPRQYRAENIDLSLHLSRASNGSYVLLGIITSADSFERVDVFEGVSAELYGARASDPPRNMDGSSARPLLQTQIDDLGNLVFDAVPVDEYVLVIHLPERELVIEGLAIEKA